MHQQDVPKSIVLQTSEGEHLGFVLLALAEDAAQGECIFIVIPAKTNLWSSPLVQSLFARKDRGESRVQVTSAAPVSLRIASVDLPDLVIELSEQGTGTWRELPPGAFPGLALVR